MIKNISILFFLFFLINPNSFAQEKLYFGQTEIGILAGRSEFKWDGKYQKRTDFTLLSYHGAQIFRNHVVGFTTGLDQYDQVSIIPFAFGYRGFIGKEGKPKIYGGLDFGMGSTILEKKIKDEWSQSWYGGGLLFSPSIGGSFPAKNGNTKLSLSIAYKRQDISFFQGALANGQQQNNPSDGLPPGFSSLQETKNLYRSLVLRIGLIY